MFCNFVFFFQDSKLTDRRTSKSNWSATLAAAGAGDENEGDAAEDEGNAVAAETSSRSTVSTLDDATADESPLASELATRVSDASPP